MAIKAKAEITLSHMIDVVGNYRYYLLQSSTSAKPAKPTTFPPSDSWDDTEPTYTSGSTNSLYIVDCSVYSNDTFYYSPVSLSTAYEAAKEAYNKAQNAQDSADNVNKELGESVDAIDKQISDQIVTVTKDCEKLVSSALESYVSTGDYGTFKERIESQIKQLAESITLTFTKTTELMNNADGDLQAQLNTIATFFTFEADGFTIGKSGNPYKIVQTNDRYSMQVNGVEILWIDAVTQSAHIPSLTITDRLIMFGYVIELDAYGNLNCDYIVTEEEEPDESDTPDVPEYQEVEYLESSEYVNGVGAYIDLGFAFDTACTVELVMYETSSAGRYIFGAAENSGKLRCMITDTLGSKGCIGYGSSGTSYGDLDLQSSYLDGQYNYYRLTLRQGLMKFENVSTGNSVEKTTQGVYTMTNNLYLFAQNYNGTVRTNSYPAIIKEFRYYDKDYNLICELVPKYRTSDGVAGMYDEVRKIFLTSAGSATFTKGADV